MIGDCEVCGRRDVEVRESEHVDRKLGRRKIVCVEDGPCFLAWREARRSWLGVRS